MAFPIELEGEELNEENRDKKIILTEHMRIVPNEPEFDDGLTLSVFEEDDDEFHIKHHMRFLKDNANMMTIKGRTNLRHHIKKHKLQLKEKEKIN